VQTSIDPVLCNLDIVVKINYAFVKTLGRGVLQYAPTSFLEMSSEFLTFPVKS